ncbi:hypothetical protein AQUCO_01400756v1 [Aquilegia coerulea]|uniref:Uncharacterized protein n=1 Tax=Aquilegia coerulea TaxID=218851 RepID=A0A2G5DXX2_AQUCA|nr:hypothetical protein AQUCO_01400756v1 [Aquilegia coerulea]
MDWEKVNGTNLITFTRLLNQDIGFIVKEQWTQMSSLLNDLKNYGCQTRTKAGQVMVFLDGLGYHETWIHF